MKKKSPSSEENNSLKNLAILLLFRPLKVVFEYFAKMISKYTKQIYQELNLVLFWVKRISLVHKQEYSDGGKNLSMMFVV